VDLPTLGRPTMPHLRLMEGFLGSWVGGRRAAAEQGGLGAGCRLTAAGGSKLGMILGHDGVGPWPDGSQGRPEAGALRPRACLQCRDANI